MSKNSFEKIFMVVAIVIMLVSSAFGSVGTASASAESPMFKNGTSNVNQKEFNQIRNALKGTEEYQKYKKDTKINSISKENIIINTVDGPKGSIAYVEFVFNKFAKKSDNLAYVQFTYDVKNADVITDQATYAKKLDGERIKISTFFNLDGVQTKIYDIVIDNEGTMFDENELVITPEKFIIDAEKNIKDAGKNIDEASTYATFCEYAISALCGTGGGVLCYAAAGALGITTGVGGVALAGVCALIGSIGCTAASDRICS